MAVIAVDRIRERGSAVSFLHVPIMQNGHAAYSFGLPVNRVIAKTVTLNLDMRPTAI
ncbi:hypothetical protein PM082_004336 [Marasmius tenuissimus]|nr:hypothetical protein PM082_004336 [Marasmius tenuissimus]